MASAGPPSTFTEKNVKPVTIMGSIGTAMLWAGWNENDLWMTVAGGAILLLTTIFAVWVFSSNQSLERSELPSNEATESDSEDEAAPGAPAVKSGEKWLRFPHEPIRSLLTVKSGDTNKAPSDDAVAYLIGVQEYLAVELLEIAGNIAKQQAKSGDDSNLPAISSSQVSQALREDKELADVLDGNTDLLLSCCSFEPDEKSLNLILEGVRGILKIAHPHAKFEEAAGRVVYEKTLLACYHVATCAKKINNKTEGKESNIGVHSKEVEAGVSEIYKGAILDHAISEGFKVGFPMQRDK
eukprot:jgi/Bigna1/145602/aug1.101_g20310